MNGILQSILPPRGWLRWKRTSHQCRQFWKSVAIPSREDIGEQSDRFLVEQPVICENVRIAKIKRRAVHICTTASGLANKKNARRYVPGMQAEFPKQIQPPARDISEIERGGSRPAHPVR